MATKEYTTERLDHLGLVAGMCHEIGLIETVDAFVGPSERKVSVGAAVQALLLNALGFVGRPLYLTPEFFDQKPVELLIQPGLEAADLNDDSLGRALDRLYERGVREVFATVAARAIRSQGLHCRFYHLDGTSFALHGNYDGETDDPGAIEITRGYSRDHRPDLKQVVLQLITTYRSALPVWLAALSGNSQDRQSFPGAIQAYLAQWDDEEEPYFVADSALYSRDNVQELEVVKWITRVPRTLKAVRALEATLRPADMRPVDDGDYRVREVCSRYGGVRQRWIVVYSPATYARASQTLDQQVATEHASATRALERLHGHEFATLEAAEQAVAELNAQWAYHQGQIQTQPVPHYGHAGRPRQDATPERVGYRVTTSRVTVDADAVAAKRQTLGKFVLATNELDAQQLSAEALLHAYKGQAGGVERGFRFLKDPLFFVDSLFLEKPTRIMAALMVMGLSLLIYALTERKLRQALQAQAVTIPDQVGKPTQRPTLRRVFQMFEGIDILLIHKPDGVERRVLNLSEVHRVIIRLLGPDVQRCYLIDI